jgi:hypothetical protein
MNLKESKVFISNLIKVPLQSIDNILNIKGYRFEDTWQLLFDCLISREMLNIKEPKQLTVSKYYGSYLFLCKNTNTYDYRLNLDLLYEIDEWVHEKKQIYHEYNNYEYIEYSHELLSKQLRIGMNPNQLSDANSWNMEQLHKQLQRKNYFYYGWENNTLVRFIKSKKYTLNYIVKHFDSITKKQITPKEMWNKCHEDIERDDGKRSYYTESYTELIKKAPKRQYRSNKLVGSNFAKRKDLDFIKNYNLYETYCNPKSSKYREILYEIDHIFPRIAFIDNDIDFDYNIIIVKYIANLTENIQIILKEENSNKNGSYTKSDFIKWFNKKLLEIIPDAEILKSI